MSTEARKCDVDEKAKHYVETFYRDRYFDWIDCYLDRLAFVQAQRRDAPGVAAENGNRFVSAP